jgi:hypothetical protein
MGSSRPGKFPARIIVVLAAEGKGELSLSAKAEDIEYLRPFVDKVVTVEITPTSSAPGEHPVGSEPDAGAAPPVPGG